MHVALYHQWYTDLQYDVQSVCRMVSHISGEKKKKANVYLFLRFAGSTEKGLINEETKNFSVLLNISSSS